MTRSTDIRPAARSALGLLKKASLFATAGASALLVASAAYAQEPGVESVTVSSSRIMNTGMNAPTPTTVLGALMIPMVLCAVCVCLLPAAFRAGGEAGRTSTP